MQETIPKLALLAGLIGFLAAVNIRGIKSGAAASNMFTVAKLAPLLCFAIAGVVFLLRVHPATPSVAQGGASAPIQSWLEAILVLIFAYGGFEGAVIPMAEATDPHRDAPLALMATVALLYSTIQYVVIGVIPAAAVTARPLAVAARQMWGTTGAVLITAGALISVYGVLTAQMLHTPRLTFALGEKGDFPQLFVRVHARYRTPHVSILVFAGIVWTCPIFETTS